MCWEAHLLNHFEIFLLLFKSIVTFPRYRKKKKQFPLRASGFVALRTSPHLRLFPPSSAQHFVPDFFPKIDLLLSTKV